LEGKALRKDLPEEEEAGIPADELRRRGAAAEPEMTDEDLLGEATLAKLQSGVFDEDQSVARAEAAKLGLAAEPAKEGEAPPSEGEAEKPPEPAEEAAPSEPAAPENS
jgi:hypothetical protein